MTVTVNLPPGEHTLTATTYSHQGHAIADEDTTLEVT
jgi:hypothetical protein